MAKRMNLLIFVVEDNKIYNKMVSGYLEKKGFTNVKSYFSGEDCLRNLTLKPDIVIQDYVLEGMNGITVLKKAKRIHPKAEFLFLSGQDNIEVAINTMKYGAFDYIMKDKVTLDRLLDRIGKIMAIRKLEKSNKQFKVLIAIFFVIVIVAVAFFTLYFLTDSFGNNW